MSTQATQHPKLIPYDIFEHVNDDGAIVTYHCLVDGKPEVFVGKSRRDPNDVPNQDVALCLAHGRALLRAGKSLAKRGAGLVKHADDVADRQQRDQARTREALLADAQRHAGIHQAADAQRMLAQAIENAERREEDAREDAVNLHDINLQDDDRDALKERVRKTLRFVRSIGARKTYKAGTELLDAIDKFSRVAHEELAQDA